MASPTDPPTAPGSYRLSFQSPAAIEFGRGMAGTVGTHAATHGSRALLVTDATLRDAGVIDPVVESLANAELDYRVFDGVTPEPSLSLARRAHRRAKEADADVVVGVGGGSTLDVAKAASVLMANPTLSDDPFGRNHVPEAGIPSVLVPTTAGTGSEVSPAIVLVDDRDGAHEKRGIVDPAAFAEVAIVDPVMTDSLPPGLTASTGIDAFSHAIGSFISTTANPLADGLCLEAMRLIDRHLRPATFHGGDAPRARTGMAMAAMLAMLGRINGGKSAIHAVAYGVQSRYDVSHGAAIALVMPAVLEYNLPACVPKLARIGTGLFSADGSQRDRAAAAVAGIRRLRDDLELPASLADVGAADADPGTIAPEAVQSTRHIEANPRPLTEADARSILAGLI